MISASINVSRDCKLPWGEKVKVPLLDKCFDNHIKNQPEKLLNGAYIYRLHFQGGGATIK